MKIRAMAAAALAVLTLVAAPTANAQVDPNYKWRNDPVSKVLAGKPFADRVLHRVPGSWFDAQRANPGAKQAAARGRALYGAGAPIYVGMYGMCTVSAVGTDGAGRKVALTAGHCGNIGDPIVASDSFAAGPTGRIVRKNGALDYAVIELGPRADLTASYNGTTIRSTGGAVRTGDQLCKNGYASGKTCGMVWVAAGPRHQSQVCAMAGDSGAPLYAGTRLVGLINGSSIPQAANLSCSTPLQGPIHAPTVSTSIDAIIRDLNSAPGVGNGFRLAR
ncbi:S1 family peptidase [uncultured Corynebacterium sp.]|uniref:S1 family peptidase n=1 Tax=uncultured Corynebacterium sp. TaxID=159447 RepID=UPI00262823E6|nr:S1 family peptidase [uncultured Corynebacterium sp.]